MSATTGTQPASPADGQVYILPAGKTGAAWGAMTTLALAYYRDGAWEQITPREGFTAFVKDSDEVLIYSGSAWLSHSTANARKLLFTPGGDGQVSLYRFDTTRIQNPRTAVVSSISGDVITLTTADAGLLFNDALMKNVSYARIWNTTKTPDQSAWAKEQPATNQLKVTSAAAISTWANGDVIQLGDPTDQTPNRVIALDISPMLQNVLGRVFRQSGVLMKAAVAGASVKASIEGSEAGVSGSFNGVGSETTGAFVGGQFTQPCSVLSPISNSNLLFVRETATGTGMGLTILSATGVWV